MQITAQVETILADMIAFTKKYGGTEMKRAFSIIIIVGLLIGMIPVTGDAAENQATVDSGNLTAEGTNGFGTLLSEEIQEQQVNDVEYSGGYNVIGLTVEDGIATVEYDTLEEAVLVVSLYTEDGLQLLVSGNTVVQPENTEAKITLEGGIPEYYMASAYLLDSYDYSPLCASYDTPMYTREMQELLASTTDDYDADKVLNLDNDKTTNFAVYAETTKVIEYAEGVNTVINVDDETATYVLENVDANITSLQTGDVFAYAYGENQILIVKVASIAVDGTTATITGDDLEMEEVFTHVKMETSGDASDVTVDESTAEEGVVYDGLSSEGVQTYSLRAVEGESGWKHYLNFKLVDKKIKDETDNADVSVSLSGSLGISLDVKFSYYVATERQFIEFKTDAGIKASISIGGKIKGKLPLPEFKLTAYGISIGFEPKIQLEFSGKAEYSVFAGFTIGVSYESGNGFHDLSTSPKVESEFKVEGSIFFGIDLAPTIEALGGAIVEAKLEVPIGIELGAELKGAWIEGTDPEAESVHNCEKCVEMELKFKAEFSAKIKFLKCKWLSLESKVKAIEIKIGDMYWSIDREEFGWGTCPYKSYRVTVYVQDSNNQNAVGTEVVAGWAEQLTEIPMGTTNSNGVVVDYLQAGTYTFMATVDGENLGKAVTIEEACKVTLDKDSVGGVPTFISGIVNAESITDNGIVASGECGADGANITWTLYGSGLLKIEGSGKIKHYGNSGSSKAPWHNYADYIETLQIGEGITRIGNCSFYNCSSLVSVSIPSSLESIGSTAFIDSEEIEEVHITDLASWCNVYLDGGYASPMCRGADLYVRGELATEITIPSTTTIGDYQFYGCTSLTSVEISNGVTSLGKYVFRDCSNLQDVKIPASIANIGYGVFYCCGNLNSILVENESEYFSSDSQGILYNKDQSLLLEAPGAIGGSVRIPASVVSINDHAFAECKNFHSISIPNSVTNIGYHSFDGCSGLTELHIPSSVTDIEESAFENCTNLTIIIIDDGLSSINYSVFEGCSSLKRVSIPPSVTQIRNFAFYECDNLSDVYYGGTEETWEVISIGTYNTKLKRATIHYNSTIDTLSTYADTLSTASVEQGLYMQSTPTNDEPMLYSIWEGEYSTEITDQYTLKTASFTGLVPGAQYVLLALVSIEVDEILAPDNLLYIDQKTAAEDGTLVFTYVQREATDISYVVACGASHNDISEATITFPTMAATEETQAVHPVVEYNGETLIEGVDYVVIGKVDYTAAGEYTCYIRGIKNYTGLVECTYTVYDMVIGDFTGDGLVTNEDVVYLLWYTLFPEDYPIIGEADFTDDGQITNEDVVYLLWYTLFPEDYPLVKKETE